MLKNIYHRVNYSSIIAPRNYPLPQIGYYNNSLLIVKSEKNNKREKLISYRIKKNVSEIC